MTPYYLNLEKEEVFYKAEAGFISFIVFPLWELLDLYLEGEIEEQVSSITKTKERYERLKEIALAKIENKLTSLAEI